MHTTNINTDTSLKGIADRLSVTVNQSWEELKEFVANASLSDGQTKVKPALPLLALCSSTREQLEMALSKMIQAEDKASIMSEKKTSVKTTIVRRRRGAGKKMVAVGTARPTRGRPRKNPIELTQPVVVKSRKRISKSTSSGPVEASTRAKRVVPEKGTYTEISTYRNYIMGAAQELGGRSPFRPVQERALEMMKADGILKPLDLKPSPGTTRIRAYAQMSALLQQMKNKGEVKSHGTGKPQEIEFIGLKPKGSRKSDAAAKEGRELVGASA